MGKKTTKPNTGLSIKRSGNKFTASWKIKTKDADSQSVRYRRHNGKKWLAWTTKTVNKGATTYTFSLDASKTINKIQVQTQIRRSPDSKYKASKWTSSSALFDLKSPPAPVLTVSNVSANQTTFSWTIEASDSGSRWYRNCQYRTKCNATPDSDTGWSDWATASNAGYTYTDTTLGTTRIFQIKAVGPGGESKVQEERHMITTAPVATWSDNKVTYSEQSSYYQLTYNATIKGSIYNVDSIVPQYFIGKPDANMGCPSDASWNDGTTYNYSDGQTGYVLALTTSELISEDECLWARIKTIHDSVPSYSSACRVITGDLAAPTASISMSGTPTASGFTVSVNITDAGTEVPGAYAEVYLEKNSTAGTYILIGSVPSGSSSASITSTEDLTKEVGYAIHVRNVTADGKSMASDYFDYTSSMPQAPVLDSVEPTTTAGKVYLSWTNRWADATGVIVAWTDDRDNWTSNDAPETFEIEEVASNWFITGLETGKEWWFRVRAVREADDNITHSSWSKDMPIDLSSAPATPALYLSEEAITENDIVTAYWSYMTTDGTAQISAEIVEAELSNGTWTYGRSAGATSSAQHIDIDAKKQGWTNGTTKYLALRTRSGSGGLSDYSTPVKLEIAAKPTVAITSTGLATTDTVTEYFEGDGSTKKFTCADALSAAPTATVNGSSRACTYSGDTVTMSTAPADGATLAITYTTTAHKVLADLPFSVTVTTANASDVTLAIERASTYPMDRPDGTQTDGAEGETIFVETAAALSSNTFTVNNSDDLIGKLDDGAEYNLVATVIDKHKQTARVEIPFKVHWSHQAWEPTATFVTDTDNYIAKITPASATGYETGDTCDIYRLGIDKPELIYPNATFGETYVDPFPAFGEHSGYKVVTVTKNGDYITDRDTFAEFDTTDGDGSYTQLDTGMLVIDFDGDRAELPYNITLDNSWSKDFQRTAYLGGHVAGDHNKAVTRDLTAGTVTTRKTNTDVIETMRKLARYPGLCHVRTPEGSSFTADVQVSEQMSFDSALASYSLTIQKVDMVGYDGMTEEEWSETQ